MLVYETTLRVPLVVSGAGTDPQPGAFSLAALGEHLLRAVGISTTGFGATREVYAETRYPARAGWHPLTALVDDRWKLILSSERELYDLRADPREERNVAPAHANVAEGMAAAARKMSVARTPGASVAPEAAERLRALGYVSGSSASAAENPKAPNPARVIEGWTEFERALGELQQGRATTAAARLTTLVSRHPGALVFQTTRAQALREAGQPRQALEIYRAVVKAFPGDAALFHDLAAAAREAGDAQEALRAEQAALALDPASGMALNGLGLLHADAGRHADAAVSFERATKADPTNASYWTNLGNARRALNDPAGAEFAYRKALEVDASFADALNGLGTLLVQSKRPADAVPLFERAVQNDPDFHEARLNLGIAYQESGQREKAAETYREILKTTPPRFSRERNAAEALLKNLR
jgi:Tfp pilus assembly protein PilF